MIDVSVIFVSYNTRELTLCAIAALYESTANSALNVEIILVDNASVDGTTEAVAARYPEVVLLPESKNFGFGGGNNRAADVARGQALFFLNTDTECRAGVVDALFEELMRDRAVGAVGARLFYPDGSHQRSVLCVPTLRRIFCEFFWLDRIGLPFFSGPFAEGLDPDLPASVEAVHVVVPVVADVATL